MIRSVAFDRSTCHPMAFHFFLSWVFPGICPFFFFWYFIATTDYWQRIYRKRNFGEGKVKIFHETWRKLCHRSSFSFHRDAKFELLWESSVYIIARSLSTGLSKKWNCERRVFESRETKEVKILETVPTIFRFVNYEGTRIRSNCTLDTMQTFHLSLIALYFFLGPLCPSRNRVPIKNYPFPYATTKSRIETKKKAF